MIKTKQNSTNRNTIFRTNNIVHSPVTMAITKMQCWFRTKDVETYPCQVIKISTRSKLNCSRALPGMRSKIVILNMNIFRSGIIANTYWLQYWIDWEVWSRQIISELRYPSQWSADPRYSPVFWQEIYDMTWVSSNGAVVFRCVLMQGKCI